jgi:hypothetical protein
MLNITNVSLNNNGFSDSVAIVSKQIMFGIKGVLRNHWKSLLPLPGKGLLVCLPLSLAFLAL